MTVEGSRPVQRYLAIASLCLSTAAIVLDGSIATIALPTIARDLGIGAAHAVHIVTIYQLVLVIGLIPMAALGDRFGFRTIYRLGLGLLIASILLCFLVGDFRSLLLLRFAQAVGAALTLSVSSALLREIYPVRILGRGLALNSMIVSIFTSLAPALGGAILACARWPMVFASAAPFAALAMVLSCVMPAPRRHRARFDAVPSALYACAMIALFAAIDVNLGMPAGLRPLMLIGAIAAVRCSSHLSEHRHALSFPWIC